MVAIVAAALLVLLTAGAVYQRLGARANARTYPAPGTMVDVEGQRLHVLCAGAGRPVVVFEAGIAASSLSWTSVMRDVIAFTRACAYDRAGLGWSAPARAPRTVATMFRELGGVLEQASHGWPCVLVGHSFGALLVFAYASRYPADVAALVLLDPPTEWRERTREQSRLLRGGIQLSRLGGVLARVGVVRACLALLTGGAPGVPRSFVRIFGPTATRTIERLVGEVRKLPPELYPVVQMHWCQPKCFQSMADHLAALEQTAAVAAGVISLSEVPLVVISGGDQPPNVIDAHRQLARLSSNGRHVVAEQTGHWIQFDAPDLVVATIRDLVDRSRAVNPCSDSRLM